MASLVTPKTLARWLLGAALLLTACDAPSTVPLDGGRPEAPLDASPSTDVEEETDAVRSEPGMPIRFRTVDGLEPPPSASPQRVLVRDASAYEALFGVPPDPALRLGERWLLAYDLGDDAAPGDRAVITRARLRGRRLDVTTSLVRSDASCPGTGATRRAVVVVLEARRIADRIDDVRFLRADRALDCAAREERDERLSTALELGRWLERSRGTFLDAPVDLEPLGRAAERSIFDAEDARQGWLIAMRETLLAFPIGHAAVYAEDFASMPSYYASRVGVCARPSGEGFVVTHVSPSRSLDLAPGDLVIAIDNEDGEAMRDTARRLPLAGTPSATPSHLRMAAALAALASPEPGSELSVRAPDGTLRTVVVPDSPPAYLDCRAPLGVDAGSTMPRVTRRPDGVAVIRVPSFYLAMAGETDIEVIRARVREAIAAAFEQARDAPAIVWDVRANFGGLTSEGLAIVSGMPGARRTPIATCEYRPDGTDDLVPDGFIDYRIEPGGALAYTGRVAVVTDALALSATDYFLLAVRAATDVPIVGTGASGGYGTAYPRRSFEGPPTLLASSDSYRCLDAEGRPLERREIVPTVEVELDPQDLARGIDTQIEAAVALVR